MIESLTIAGPIALVRSFTLSPAADLPKPALPEPLAIPDPDAPVGPKPTFTVTPMERLQEDLRALPRPAPETAVAGASTPRAEDVASRPDTAPGAAFSEPRDAGIVDRRA
jgi:hypothetical protein